MASPSRERHLTGHFDALREKMALMRSFRSSSVVVIVLALALLAAGCSKSDSPVVRSPTTPSTTFSVEVASSDLYIGAPQRVQLGLFQSSGQGVKLVTFGTVEFRFSPLGQTASSAPPGPALNATYLPAPGTPVGDAPTLSDPNTARGVYQVEGVTFDHAGVWKVDVTADVAGVGSLALSADFAVATKPALPAPGQLALKTANLTLSSKGVPQSAIDSRALDGAPIPDPDLHRWTIADALAQHRPILVVFSTPTYCVSRFCGPSTDGVEQLATRYAKKAVFIHVEIWRDFNKHQINKGAADWLYRNGNLTEPWLFLIGARGRILDRWSPLFDMGEVAADLAKLPDMKP